MPTIGRIQEEIEDIEAIHAISGAQLEVAALSIKQIKGDFERNYIFFDEISELYNIVKLSASRLPTKSDSVTKIDGEGQAQDIKKKKKGKICVAITSNQRFHGLLNRRVMESFVSAISLEDSDCVVIGNTGGQYLENSVFFERCKFLTFKNDYPTQGEADNFMKIMDDYNEVFLYHPKFVTVFSQEVGVVDITHAPERDIEKVKEVEYIYEPELPKINEFFELQVRRLLFMRIMLESELARTSARLVKMNTTETRASEIIEDRKIDLRKELLLQNDIRLLESFSSIGKWKK
jgi:F0F1-type ATP synthase gamma subunit